MNKQKNTLITDLDDSFLTNFQKNDDNVSQNLNRKRRRLNEDENLSSGSIQLKILHKFKDSI